MKSAAQVKAGTADTARALTSRDVVQGVFVMAGDSAVWKPVRTGLSSDRHIEVLSGLALGDSVINGPYRVLARELTQGAKIQIKKPAAKGPGSSSGDGTEALHRLPRRNGCRQRTDRATSQHAPACM